MCEFSILMQSVVLSSFAALYQIPVTCTRLQWPHHAHRRPGYICVGDHALALLRMLYSFFFFYSTSPNFALAVQA